MTETIVHLGDNAHEVARKFVCFFSKEAGNKERFNVALSGGSTPKIVFDLFVREYADKIDWTKIHFYWSDERCVPPDDSESNYKMTKDHLFNFISIPDQNIHRIKGEISPEKESLRYAGEINKIKDAVFDLIILGMGDDGHTASIFPHQLELLESMTVTAIATHPLSGQKRVTLTGTVINRANKVAFLVTGEAKRPKMEEIFRKSGSWESYPAAYIKPQGELHWFTDIDITK